MKKRTLLFLFRGRQDHMYAALLLLWENYKQHQPDFARKNAKYTVALAEEQQQAIEAARKMPGISVRRSIPKGTRIVLAGAAGVCRNSWQDLASIIENSFPEDEWALRKSLAGYGSYQKAAAQQWDAVVTLTNAAVSFIKDNSQALIAGGMLPHFPEEFAGVKRDYDTLFNQFYNAKQAFNCQTTDKGRASNAVYKTACSLMRDGKKIYRDNPAIRSGFIYSSLIRVVRGEGFTKSGYVFIVTSTGGKVPVTNASVTITSGTVTKSAVANEKGMLRCLLPAGPYLYTLTAPGFTTVMGSVTVKSGTPHQKKFVLPPVAAAEVFMQQANAV